MPDIQPYFKIFIMINKVEKSLVFLAINMFNSDIFYIVYYDSSNAEVILVVKPQLKIISFES